MAITNYPCKWSLTILRMYLSTHWTKHILRILQLHTHMIRRSNNFIPNYSNSLCRICIAMRTNIILRSNSNYKPFISNSLCRKRGSRMSMRWVRSRQRHTNTIFRPTLPTTICNHSNSINSPSISTSNRIQQSPRIKQKHRQNPIPPLLHSKGYLWVRSNTHITNYINLKGTLYSKRSRQLHTSQSASNTSAYSTRVILPIRIRNSTINP